MDFTKPDDRTPEYISKARAHGLRIRQSAPVRRGPLPFTLPILDYLNSHRVILASMSPRRKALLGQVGLTNLEIVPSTKPEDLSKTEHTPDEYVVATAREKCLHVYQELLQKAEEGDNDDATDPEVVIAADTIIATRSGGILEKPRSEEDHKRMLRHLRDTRFHRVLTSVCVLAPKEDAGHPGYEIASVTEETKVFFAQEEDGLGDEVIDAYVRTREGSDKAGGYAVQGVGGMMLVERLEGGVDNVVGLPVRKCLQLCEKVVFRQGDDDLNEDSDQE